MTANITLFVKPLSAQTVNIGANQTNTVNKNINNTSNENPQLLQLNTNNKIDDSGGKTHLPSNNEPKTNLIINYLPPMMNEGTLATLFSPYGTLMHCKIVYDYNTNRSRGYGFVKYGNDKSAERALQALNGHYVQGKTLKVAFARTKGKYIQNSNLYISNIPLHFTSSQLRTNFCDFGEIVECRILKDENGKSRGVGFVRMDSHHHAINALNARDQYIVEQGMQPLSVKLAQRRNQRKYTHKKHYTKQKNIRHAHGYLPAQWNNNMQDNFNSGQRNRYKIREQANAPLPETLQNSMYYMYADPISPYAYPPMPTFANNYMTAPVQLSNNL